MITHPLSSVACDPATTNQTKHTLLLLICTPLQAVTPEELYGYIHPATREWRDGLLSKIMRDLGAEPGDDPKWILLDGA